MKVLTRPTKTQPKKRAVLTARQLRVLVSKAWRGKMTAVEAVREQRDKPYYHS